MFERDYLMRILQTFFEDVAKVIHRKLHPDDEQQLEAFGDLYKNYLKNDRSYFYDSATGDLIASFSKDTDGIYKAEMAATLLYQDALLQKDKTFRDELLGKSLALYQYIDQVSKDFSTERKDIIANIKGWLR